MSQYLKSLEKERGQGLLKPLHIDQVLPVLRLYYSMRLYTWDQARSLDQTLLWPLHIDQVLPVLRLCYSMQ